MVQQNKYPALLLNADFSPINLFPLETLDWHRSVRGVIQEKLIVVAEYDDIIRSTSISMKPPSVVALKEYRKVPRTVPFSRTNIWLRDKGKCVYCNHDVETSSLTFDHVIPKAKGGMTNWMNIVCACVACNVRKADKLPKEIKMFPNPAPRQPTQFELAKNAKILMRKTPMHKSWIDYLYWDTELTN